MMTSPPPPTPRDHFSTLPTELLRLIFSHLTPYHIESSLRPVCRRFNLVILNDKRLSLAYGLPPAIWERVFKYVLHSSPAPRHPTWQPARDFHNNFFNAMAAVTAGLPPGATVLPPQTQPGNTYNRFFGQLNRRIRLGLDNDAVVESTFRTLVELEGFEGSPAIENALFIAPLSERNRAKPGCDWANGEVRVNFLLSGLSDRFLRGEGPKKRQDAAGPGRLESLSWEEMKRNATAPPTDRVFVNVWGMMKGEENASSSKGKQKLESSGWRCQARILVTSFKGSGKAVDVGDVVRELKRWFKKPALAGDSETGSGDGSRRRVKGYNGCDSYDRGSAASGHGGKWWTATLWGGCEYTYGDALQGQFEKMDVAGVGEGGEVYLDAKFSVVSVV